MSSFESPTKIALREQIAKQGETVGHLHGQLQSERDRNAMELAQQRRTFSAAAQQQELAARESTSVAVATATEQISAEYQRQSQAVQQEMLRLQREAAQAQALAAQQASEIARMSREQAERQDAASRSAVIIERGVQEQSEETLLIPSAAPASIMPNSSGLVQPSYQVSSYEVPPPPIPHNEPTVPMSTSPQRAGIPEDFQSPLEDRSALLQTLEQPTLPIRSDAVASASRPTVEPLRDAVASATVHTPGRRWKGSCAQYTATQQCSHGDRCAFAHARQKPPTHRQLSFERTPPPLSDADASARIPNQAAPILSSPTPIQQELDRLKAQLISRDKQIADQDDEIQKRYQELHHAQM